MLLPYRGDILAMRFEIGTQALRAERKLNRILDRIEQIDHQAAHLRLVHWPKPHLVLVHQDDVVRGYSMAGAPITRRSWR